METKYKIGDKVKVSSDNDNEAYDDFRSKTLVIAHIAKSKEEHPGFDEGVNEPLYDFVDEKNAEFPFSLYECEIQEA